MGSSEKVLKKKKHYKSLSNIHHAFAILKTEPQKEMFNFGISEISQLFVGNKQGFLSITGLHFQVNKESLLIGTVPGIPLEYT